MPTIITLQRRATIWLKDEFQPRALSKSLPAALVIFIFEVLIFISLSALIYTGPLAVNLPNIVGLVLLGGAVQCAIVAMFSSNPGSIARAENAPAAILGLTAAVIIAAMPAGSAPMQQYATVTVMVVLTALLTGLIFIALGALKLGALVRFLPYPVIGGFLAGTGWLVLKGGITTMTAGRFDLSLFAPQTLIYWLPGVLLGVIVLIGTNGIKHPFFLPGVLLGAGLVFYLAAFAAGKTVTQLIGEGWLVGSISTESLAIAPLSWPVLGQVNWPLLLAQTPSLLLAGGISVVSFLLNASGIELVVHRDTNLDKELVLVGVSNLAVVPFGGLTGFTSFSLSAFNHNIGGNRRLTGLIVAILLAVAAIGGSALIAYIPKLILGALLTYLGLVLLVEWVIQAWFKFPKVDFVIVVVILGMIIARGYLEGIAAGLVLAIMMFVITYSQVRVVRFALTGQSRRSRVVRSRVQQQILEEHGHTLHILVLQGFLFFGTANGLLEYIKSLVSATGSNVRYLLLDFANVNGMDSSGLISFNRILDFASEHHMQLILTGLHGRSEQQFQQLRAQSMTTILTFMPDLDHGIEWCENEIISAFKPDTEHASTLKEQLAAYLPAGSDLEKMFAYFKHETVAPGDYLIRQGNEADSLFFVENGQVTTYLELPEGRRMRLETIRSGNVVGEIGLYLGSRRSASVIADEPTTVYILYRKELNEIDLHDAEAARMIHRIIAYLLGRRVVHLTGVVEGMSR